jgi:hypothetical protein
VCVWGGGWAEIKFSAGTLTMNRVVIRVAHDLYMRVCRYATA